MARGLAAAREAGIIHRDLEPHNIFHARLSETQRVWKILDFGISKIASGVATITQGQIVGTPAYMAPEQARGEKVDHRSDVFSLGVIAYRCLTGHPAFSGSDVHAVMFDVIHNVPVRPSALCSLPEAVDRVLAVAMAKSPEDRFDRAEDLAEALRLALSNSVGRSGPSST